MDWRPADPIKEITLRAWNARVVAEDCRCWWWWLLGGFTTNFIWCVILNVRNRNTGHNIFKADTRGEPLSCVGAGMWGFLKM